MVGAMVWSRPMKRYALVIVGLKLVLLAMFGLVTALGVPLLTDPAPWMGEASVGVAALGVGLLVADVLIPVPSSLVMVAHGALFGSALGAFLSVFGSVLAAAFGFWLGRRGGPLLDRVMSPEERARGDRLIARHGGMAVVLSRPLPILAETVSIIAGTSPMRWSKLLLAATLGVLPPAVLYAITGASAATLDDQFLMFGAVMGSAVVFWLVTRAVERRLSPEAGEPAPGEPAP